MTLAPIDNNPKLLSFLKTRAPFSIIERGVDIASEGKVTECARSGSRLQGSISVSPEENYSTSLNLISERVVEGSCSCSSQDEMNEQWCSHAIALCWRAHELGFFEPQGGFDSQESAFRLNSSSPEEIAEALCKLSEPDTSIFSEGEFYPQVSIYLKPHSDQLAVRIFFNNEQQVPSPFEGMRQVSARSLDNVLLAHLEEDGSWDETQRWWLLASSRSIEHVIGLTREYQRVFLMDGSDGETKTPVIFSKQAVDASMTIDWKSSAVELCFKWVLPDKSQASKSEDLIGTGPYWVMLSDTWYRVTPKAVLLATIFPYTSQFTLARSQVGAILEVLSTTLVDSQRVTILHPELQPRIEIHEPVPVLKLERINTQNEHFSSRESIELNAELTFTYPEAPRSENVVYLPNRKSEHTYQDRLSELGFVFNSAKKQYFIRGEATLDFLNQGHSTLSAPWLLEGLDLARKGIRFAELNFNVALSASESADGEDRSKKRKRSAISNTQDYWFDCQVTLTQNNIHIPISTLFKHSRSDEERWIKLDSGAFAKIPGGGINQLKTSFGMLDANFRLSNQIKSKLSLPQALGMGLITEPNFKIQLDQKLTELAERLQNFTQIKKLEISKHFIGTLRPYQADGLNWLHFLRDMRLGGILADEMGLGKTVQAIALLQHLKDLYGDDESQHKPTLVVAPTSVITNWMYELQRFAPKLKPLLIHGAGRKRFFSDIPTHDVVITSYALLRLDRSELERHEFRYIILDEAQNIKNPEAATTKAAKALKAECRLALTGTPTENRPLELWSIVDFLMPGYLGTHDYFKNFIERPIIENVTDSRATQFLQRKTKPFILRRRKDQVERDLPAKTESTVYVQMSDSQRQVYSKILEEIRPKVFEAVKEKGIGGASVSILAALLRLRQICNHPYSIEALKGVPNLDSGKFNQLKEIVTEAVESGRKLLLFSQFRDMLAIIRTWLEGANIKHLYLDGATRDRQTLIDRFNHDQNVRLFLISLKAGGTGLNLTAADTVIIYDPWWNPAVENQAVDRAHRIGQDKPVTVYRLVTEDSVERKIMELKAKKSRIVNALIDGEEGVSVSKLTKADLESLFSPLSKVEE